MNLDPNTIVEALGEAQVSQQAHAIRTSVRHAAEDVAARRQSIIDDLEAGTSAARILRWDFSDAVEAEAVYETLKRTAAEDPDTPDEVVVLAAARIIASETQGRSLASIVRNGIGTGSGMGGGRLADTVSLLGTLSAVQTLTQHLEYGVQVANLDRAPWDQAS